MSAYIVTTDTIDRIVTYVGDTAARDVFQAANATTSQELGQALLQMNVNAVNHRYREQTPVPVYRYTPRPTSRIQLVKTLDCYLYQCSEGDIPERQLFRALRRLQGHVGLSIIRSLPEYARAAWG